MILRAALATTLTLATAAAGAQPMASVVDCYGSALHDEESAWGDYVVSILDGGLLFYERARRDGVDVHQFVIEHCPSGDSLEAAFVNPPDSATPFAQRDAYRDTLFDAIDSTVRYSLGDLARMADQAGGTGRVRRADYTSCACRLFGGT